MICRSIACSMFASPVRSLSNVGITSSWIPHWPFDEHVRRQTSSLRHAWSYLALGSPWTKVLLTPLSVPPPLPFAWWGTRLADLDGGDPWDTGERRLYRVTRFPLALTR